MTSGRRRGPRQEDGCLMLQVRHGPQIIVNAHACAANRGCCVCAPVARRRALARRWLRRVRPYYDAPGKADQFLVVSSPCQGCETGSMTAGHPTDSANPIQDLHRGDQRSLHPVKKPSNVVLSRCRSCHYHSVSEAECIDLPWRGEIVYPQK